MNNQEFTSKDTIAIGLMMFALFLGAGNLIFPPALGQAAGTSVWSAIAGFLVTGVGLPILAIIAIAISGGDLQKVSERVGPTFAAIFPLTVYLAIGPLFGIPRTGSVAYEIGVVPYLTDGASALSLLIFTFCFFSVSYWLSLNPSKLVGRIGKLLTPVIVIILTILTITGIVKPMDGVGEPTGAYEQFAFFAGFQDGYFTMDAIAALVFGIVIITRMKERGMTSKKELTRRAIQVGLIAGGGLAFVYLSLAFLGSTSMQSIGYQDNGGVILTRISQELLGNFGLVLLSIVITIACLTTSVGLISSFGEYIQRIFPKIPYYLTTGIIALFSLSLANMGLSELIQFSLPLLIMIYPIAIVLILLTLFKGLFNENKYIFKGAVIGAAIVSIPDGLSQTESWGKLFQSLMDILPFAAMGMAWLIPAVVGSCIGALLSREKWAMSK
ncbi:branched-chain amino acid:cation transporter, LIVCS family [Evansella caseinilytica]|uniref:Branched-chain amino acid transport system carrier protein n=1 Tax=Evansella caseinilytica TaxID=1503961 RepID=A0A1H3RRB8_9BACI|nr:branched-chain amino acid transport system II carrier protein [Evansella caseinilytica]SDZ28324.1 branched-chain amino acid:cation transporter, LIVCS family [Evansella caseinilytica]